MIESEIQVRIVSSVAEFWKERVVTPDFIALASGKEIGHRIADYVDEKTTDLLEGIVSTQRQYSRGGSLRDRSMGDIWVLSAGIYNPVNVKAGVLGTTGQPNMVSLKKLLRALLLRQIDSYYLLMVKTDARTGRVHVDMCDLLDYLDYITFDSGPGQLMLKEKKFYEAREEKITVAELSINEKIAKLFLLLEDADRRLIQNRERVAADIEELHRLYRAAGDKPLDQSGLNLK